MRVEIECRGKPLSKVGRDIALFGKQLAGELTVDAEPARKIGGRKAVMREEIFAQNFAGMEGRAVAALFSGLVGLPDGGIGCHRWDVF